MDVVSRLNCARSDNEFIDLSSVSSYVRSSSVYLDIESLSNTGNDVLFIKTLNVYLIWKSAS